MGSQTKEGNIDGAEGLFEGRPLSWSTFKSPVSILKHRHGGTVKTLYIWVALLSVWCSGMTVTYAQTAEGFSYDFAETGRISFGGASSGVFVAATGAPNLLVSGIGTNSFTWGLGVGSPPSSLSFVGRSLDGAFPEQRFVLGTLSYINGTVLYGTEAFSVGLQTTLSFSGLTQNFDYGLELINTANTNDPFEGADSVLLSNSIPTTRFSVDGVDYSLQLAFGSVTGSGFSEVNQFFVLEGGSASADLIGAITAQLGGSQPAPTAVPEPSTVLGGLFAGVLILAFFLRRFRRDPSALPV